MREVKVLTPPVLNEQEERTTDLHSLINVLNIITLQLGELDMDFPDYGGKLRAIENEIADLAHAFQTEEDLTPLVTQLRETEAKIIGLLEQMLSTIDFPDHVAQLRAAKENFESIYQILNTRLDEFVYRLDNPNVWIEITIEELNKQIHDVFSAIEKNANGRYYIRFNLALKDQGDYYIDLKIETSHKDRKLRMPLRLQDVLRDLLANARKYTEPGGKVALAVYQNDERLQCVIEDNGCGIPEEELEDVTAFGYRATNVRRYKTMGGGFGLTKAAWLVLGWGGQFTIASGREEGTRIKLTIPNQDPA